MNLLVIGGGGREHAIVRKLKENPEVETIYCLPGNGGIAADAVCVADIGAKDIPAQVAFAKSHDIDFAVVAPDDPLVLGAVDALEAAGIPCFGPEAKAAIIEGSKVFSKDLMKKYGIPTAEYQVFTDAGDAMDYVKTCPLPVVVKADGLALGKGVLIADVLLHVGLGTFRPVSAETVEEHHMHSEYFEVTERSAAAINAARAAGGRIVAVGTTSCRTLESVADDAGIVHARSGWTDIFITPGYRFKAVDALITNFHLPESTLLMLVSALCSREEILSVYEHAVRERYRFFSFGDAMFLQ